MVKDLRLFLNGIRTSWKGMRLTLAHLRKSGHRQTNQDVQSVDYFNDRDGQSTLVYPYEQIPLPDHGRYQLHNEIEDCIVCDKCAKICPVDCIDIEPIKSASEFGKTSDGTSKRIYAAKFDIDMAKCCFCGLCTTVCPTECLTMTPEYDFSVFELGKLNFGFGNMTEEEAEAKRLEWETAQLKKQEQKVAAEKSPAPTPADDSVSGSAGYKPRLRPVVGPAGDSVVMPQMPSPAAGKEPGPDVKAPSADPSGQESSSASEVPPAYQPRMRPVVKPVPVPENPADPAAPPADASGQESTPASEAPPAYQPRMRPVMKPAPASAPENPSGTDVPEQKASETPSRPQRPRPLMSKPGQESSPEPPANE